MQAHGSGVFLLAMLASIASGCGTAASVTDASVDAGASVDVRLDDAHFEYPDTGPGCPPPPERCIQSRCQDGIVQIWTGFSCGQCSYGPFSAPPCPAGCREGLLSEVLLDLCVDTPVPRGAPCRVDADCAPAVPDEDEYGLGHDPVLTCDATGHCVGITRPPLEVCGNAADDDTDTRIDEGCGCTARTFPSTTPSPSFAAFGGPHVVTAHWSDLGGTSELLSADGALVTTWPVGGAFENGLYVSAAQGHGELLVLRHSMGFIDGLVRYRDDDSVTSTELDRDPGERAQVAAWGADYVVLSDASDGVWTLARFGGSPLVRRDAATLRVDANARLVTAELDGGELLVVASLASAAPRLFVFDTTLAVRELPAATVARRGVVRTLAATSDRFWMPLIDDAHITSLVAVERTTGAWAEAVPVGLVLSNTHLVAVRDPIQVAAVGQTLFAIWVDDHAALRTLALDRAGLRLGHTSLSVPMWLGDSELFVGTTDAGLRAEVSGPTDWSLAAPCDLP